MSAMGEVRQTIREAGEPALAVLDAIDVEHDSDADPQLTEALEHLVQLRDELIARQRAGEACGSWLAQVNRMLSGIFGVEYPVGGIQWDRIRRTRDELRDMLRSLLNESDQQ